MNHYELHCKVYMKRDISFRESFEVLAKYISFSMAQDSMLKAIHDKEYAYKHYTFGNFYPTEKDQIYKSDSLYTFRLRSPDASFVNALSKCLRGNINNPNFLVINVERHAVAEYGISELYTLTPTVVTTDPRVYWTVDRDGDILRLQRLLHDNLEKKYADFYGEKLEPERNFIQFIELKNDKAQRIWMSKKSGNEKVISYHFIGNKFRIVPHEDVVSQKLAFLALGCGLGEKNAFGGGFVLGKGVERG